MSDEEFLRQFISCTFPIADLHHREHLRVAYLYVRHFGLAGAREKVREALKAFLAAYNVTDSPDTPDKGYHETMTVAWLRLVDTTMREYGPAENSDAFLSQHPELLEKKVLRFFYSKPLFQSLKAKAEFVEPDLAPLPVSYRKEV